MIKSINDKCPFENSDPDPITFVLEIANLIFQPGSLATIANIAQVVAGSATVAAATITWKNLNEQKRLDIRKKLFTIDRSLTKGFSCLMTLSSLLDEFGYLEKKVAIGKAPITGVDNKRLM